MSRGRTTNAIVLQSVFFLALGVLPLGTLRAQESVCLKTGFCLDADSHLITDGTLIVQSGNGTVQFPLDQIDTITGLPKVVTPEIPQTTLKPANLISTPDTKDILMRAALDQGLEPEFVRSVAIVESDLDQRVVSNKGAIGLMQLLPTTAGQFGVDPWNMEQNAKGGAAFLRQLLIKYNGNSALALAAYNAGPGAVDKYRGVPPYAETQHYVVKVLAEYARQQRLLQKNLQAAKPASTSTALQAQTSKPVGQTSLQQ